MNHNGIALSEPVLETGENTLTGQLLVSASPHVRAAESVATIMWRVNLTLAPAALFGAINFGLPALITMLVSVAGAVATEALVQVWQKKPVTVNDGSAFLTGLLLAMCLPPALPWYMTLLGAAVSIGVAKHMMGGLGGNVFNPAHIGRAFLFASYPAAMTTFAVSRISSIAQPLHQINTSFLSLDAVTSATPLGILKHKGYASLVELFSGKVPLYKSLFLGNHSGCIGETSALLLLLGGIYLALRGTIKWQTPLVMLGTVGIIGWVFGGQAGMFSGDPLFHMMAGGVVLGAIYMATDPVTVPISCKGQMIFAFGAGVLTMLIRLIGGYPEGVCYAILLMNAVTPMIDKYIYPKKFGNA